MKPKSLPIVDLKTLSKADAIVRRGTRDAVREEVPRPMEPRNGADGQTRTLSMSQFVEIGSLARLFRMSAWSAKQMQSFDYILLAVVLVLTGMGTVMVYSSSSVLAAARFEDASFYLLRHVSRVIVGIAAMYGATRLPIRTIGRISGGLMVVSIGLLVVLLVMKLVDPSGAAKGAYRWIRLPGFSFQPSEFARLAFLFFLASMLSKQQKRLADFKQGVLPHVVILGIVLGLIVAQPDLSTAVAIAVTAGIVLLAAGMRIRHALLLGGVMIGAVVVLTWIEPYRMRRVTDFWLLSLLSGEESQMSYQIRQGFVAMGSGGIFGRGLGQSLQKYFFLPEPHTDSVFAIVGEEFGILGTLTIVALFAVLGRQGYRIAVRQTELFPYLLAVGLTAGIMVYGTLNICVMLGLVPATGLPLPFMSYGGSAIVFNLFSVGLLLNLSRTTGRTDGGGASSAGTDKVDT